MNQGRAFMLQGNHSEARASFEQAIAVFAACGSLNDIALVLVNFGDLFFQQGHLEGAVAALSDSVAAWEACVVGGAEWLKVEYAYALYSLADVLFLLGHYREALEKTEQAAVIQRDIVKFTNAPQDENNLNDILKLRSDIQTVIENGEPMA
jgi:tetratricopeptide (TPR) repeat protein